jgi:hypothetical protein
MSIVCCTRVRSSARAHACSTHQHTRTPPHNPPTRARTDVRVCARACAHHGSSKSSATLRRAPPVVSGARLVNMRAAPGVSRFEGDSCRASWETDWTRAPIVDAKAEPGVGFERGRRRWTGIFACLVSTGRGILPPARAFATSRLHTPQRHCATFRECSLCQVCLYTGDGAGGSPARDDAGADRGECGGQGRGARA